METVSPEAALRVRNLVRDDLESRFADLCLSQGIVREADLHTCRDEKRRLDREGQSLTLGQLLLRKQLIQTDDYMRLLESWYRSMGRPTASAPVGSTLGRYEIQGEIGRGGLGTVHRALDTQLKRVVALKTLRTDCAAPSVLGERLRREAEAGARLSHPNIVTVHDGGVIDDVPFVCMELVEGVEFSQLMGKRDRRELVEMLRKIADAVEYAHEKGVIHRDIKPGNVIIDHAGEPHVIDFGLSRILDPDLKLSLTGHLVGTPLYMSPEQVRDPRSAGKLSDVYSLGVCLYEILTGKYPFDGMIPHEVYQQILNKEPVSPRKRTPDVPTDLDTICRKAMAKSVHGRYAGAGEMAADLGRWLNGQAITARPPGLLETLGRRLRRWKWPVTATILLGVLGFLAVWGIQSSSRAERLGRHKEILERARPLEALIQETEPHFYIADTDIAARLRRVEEAVRDLEAIIAREDFKDAWETVGKGWYLVGDLVKAELAFQRARAHARLVRVHIDWALRELTLEGSQAARMRRAMDWFTRAFLRCEEFGLEFGDLDSHRVEVYREFAAGGNVRGRCEDGLKRFGTVLGVEEYYCLIGLQLPVAERIAFYDKAIRKKPHYSWAHLLRGEANYLLGNAAEAEEDFGRAVHSNPRSAIAWNNRGALRSLRGEPKLAKTDLDRAVFLDPQLGNAWANRALVLLQLGQREEALVDGAQAVELGPESSNAYYARGLVREATGNHEEARADLDHALELWPDSAAALTARARLLRRAGMRDDAWDDLKRALKLNPNLALAYVHRGELYLDRGKPQSAWRDFERALRINGNDYLALYYRSTFKAESGDLQGAEDDLRRSIQIFADYAPAQTTLGMLLESRGMLDEALHYHNEALRILPEYPDALLNRGLVRLKKKNHAGAIRDLEAALRHAPASWNNRAMTEQFLKEARKSRD